MVLLLLVSLFASQSGDDLVARWAFDGDVKSSGAALIPTEALGRLEFIDSPIGGSGKMVVLNGVDGRIGISPTTDLLSDEFTLGAWIFLMDLKPTSLFARPGWSLELKADGVIGESPSLKSPPQTALARFWMHVALTRRKTDAGVEKTIWLNGEPVATGADAGAPSGWPLTAGPSAGLMDDLRIYRRALRREELCKLVDEGLPWIRPKARVKTPFAGKFELLPDDVLVFVGGENLRVGLDLGYLETLISLRSPRGVRFRNMAWEGDTVTEQLRPANFGSWSDQFRRAGASVLVAQFGQIEALEGKAGLERFEGAYEALLEQFARTTKRMVLLSPTPFARPGLRQPDLSARNDDLKLYVEAIRKLAAKHGCLFVDLTTKPLSAEALTRDGLHLTGAGHWIAAKETLRQLEVAGVSDLDEPTPQGAFPREAYEAVRAGIRHKNLLWSSSWRPTNWAFLNGDRMDQPSSRDHLDRRIRWFPTEIQQFPALVRRDEEKIDALLRATEKK
jgi:hypothetical protein